MSKKLISLAFARAAALSRQIRQRNLAKNSLILGVLLGFAVLPLAVHALGFGGIKLNSALNEPFDAEIELLSATAADVEGLKVRIADKSAFARAGVDRPTFLTKIKFKVVRRSSGSYFIHMTTRQPVREPFMNFLLEMDWPNGRMLREYTVLLDPPDLFHRQPTVVQAPETQPPAEITRVEPAPLAPEPVAEPELAPEPATQALPEPVLAPEPVAEPVPEPAPRAYAEPQPVVEPAPVPVAEPEPELAPPPEPAVEIVEEPAPAVEEQTAAAEPEPFAEDQLFPLIPLTEYREPRESDYAQPAGEEPFGEPTLQAEETPAEPPVAGELDYGLTRKGDNLWNIAERLRPDDSVTIYQVMMALINSNPDAFVDGNVHRLKVGRVMRISDPSLLTAMSAQQAAAEYRRQTEAWNQYRESVAKIDTTEQPLLAGDTETPVAEVATTEPQGELTVEPPSGEASAGAGVQEQAEAQSAALIALRDEVSQAIEQARNDPNATPQQHARLNLLMEELERLERMVSIEDDQLAALQAELSKIEEAKQAVAAAPETAEAPAAEAPAPVEEAPPEPVAPVAEEAVGGEAAPPAEEPLESQEIAEAEVLPAGEGEAAGEEAAGAETEATPPPQATVPPVAEAPAPAPEEPGIVGKILGWLGGIGGFFAALLSGNPLMMAAGGAAIVVLLLGYVLWRRRQASAEAGESILTGDASAAPAEGAAAAEAGPVSEESSFLSDFAISGMNAIQAEDSEVDPITEADVFMAYGRYEAAEERLKDAIRNEPNRNELKLKLIELYYTTKNKPQFEATAEELYAALGDAADTDAGWEKVLGMGAELAPDNPLFKAAAAAGASSEIDVGASMSESEIMDIGLDTGIFQSQELAQEAPTGEINNAETMVASSDNLDFNLDSELEPNTQSADSGSIAMDLGGGTEFDLETNTQGATAVAEESQESKPSEAFELDTTMAEPTKSEEFDLDTGAPTRSEEFDLGTAEPARSEEFDMAKAGESQEFDLGDLSPASSQEFDLELPDTTSVDLGTRADDALLDMNLEAADAADTDLAGSADEVGTKLDLAKAYIDMGDPDGARSILDEVLEEGDNTQKQEAQQLMQQIG